MATLLTEPSGWIKIISRGILTSFIQNRTNWGFPISNSIPLFCGNDERNLSPYFNSCGFFATSSSIFLSPTTAIALTGNCWGERAAKASRVSSIDPIAKLKPAIGPIMFKYFSRTWGVLKEFFPLGRIVAWGVWGALLIISSSKYINVANSVLRGVCRRRR